VPKNKELPSLDGSRTAGNLRRAFALEAALASQYLYCAALAEYEGLEKASALFKELAAGGTQSAHGSFDFLKHAADPESGLTVGATAKNVELLLQNEAALSARDYPAMAAAARQEGFHDAAAWFDTLEKLKRSHARRLKKLSRG
jgi:rubrerythrin